MAFLQRQWLLLAFLVTIFIAGVLAHGDHGEEVHYAPKAATVVPGAESAAIERAGLLSLEAIEEGLKSCSLVRDLDAHKVATASPTGGIMSKIFATLFPGSPAVNSILATIYISGPPSMSPITHQLNYHTPMLTTPLDFLLALCPPNIDPSSLSIMVSFAVGGLLGDTLFHLLPEIFLGEDPHDSVKFVLVEPNRNLLLGVAILCGFVTFVAMDKGLRIATGGAGHSHDHSGHEHNQVLDHKEEAEASGASVGPAGSLRSRSKKDTPATPGAIAVPAPTTGEREISPSAKLGGILNLLADFTHNITDGLALSSSFYASPTIGATTTVAVFFHEIPHEVGDFALLIQSGFSKRKAMGAQFVTAVGAFIGTFAGIAVNEWSGSGDKTGAGADIFVSRTAGLAGTSLSWGDLLLPFTAGTFLYVGTVAVIPELLETSGTKSQELVKTAQQFVAMATGAGIMLYISWT
jgi:solute carrier family 39 (zinc transporter), member 7